MSIKTFFFGKNEIEKKIDDLTELVKNINKKIDNTNAAVLVFASTSVSKPETYKKRVDDLTEDLRNTDYINIPEEAYRKARQRKPTEDSSQQH